MSNTNPSAETLVEFPTDWPIKLAGANEPGLVDAIAHIVQQFDPSFDAQNISQRESRGGKYLGLSLTVHVTSREQLDDLYRALSAHPMIRWAL